MGMEDFEMLRRPNRYNVDEFVEELRRIIGNISDDNSQATEALTDLTQSLLIDEADCGCKSTINFKQKIVKIDLNPECKDIEDLGKTDDWLIEDAVRDLRDGKHLISCVPGDGLCDCAIRRIGGLIQ